MKQKLIALTGKKDKSIIIVGDFSILTDRTIRQKISKHIELNNITSKQDLIEIYRTPYHNKILQTAWFKKEKFIFYHSLEARSPRS